MANPVYQINSPLGIDVWDKDGDLKVYYLNLNVFRNTNKFVLNQRKRDYAAIMKPVVSQLPKFKQLNIRYRLFTQSKRRTDIMNVISVVDKFFCDCLTENEIITDDNYSVITKVICEFGGIDPDNPRVEIYLQEQSNE